jgi:hypothetical protein
MAGVVTNEQVADAVLVTIAAEHLSLPLAVTVLLTEQESAGAVKLVVKRLNAPGAKVMGPITAVLSVGWLFTTNTLVSVMLPELLTMPE